MDIKKEKKTDNKKLQKKLKMQAYKKKEDMEKRNQNKAKKLSELEG